jgi:hypothetical protein
VRRLGAVILASALAVALASAPAALADAAVQHGRGHSTSPAQPYAGNSEPSDWLGSYVVDGQQVWSVAFGYASPDTDEVYDIGNPLLTKWGTDLPADVAADLAYLLLVHGGDADDDTAAAIAYLLHAATSAPQNPSQLDPSNDFQHIAFDAPFHLSKLPDSTQSRVTALMAEAVSQRRPWTLAVTPPASLQVGRPNVWTVHAEAASGDPVPGRDITFSARDGDLSTTGVTLDANGDASVTVTPTRRVVSVSAGMHVPFPVPPAFPALAAGTVPVVRGGGGLTAIWTAQATAATGVFTTGPDAAVLGRPRVGKRLRAEVGSPHPTGNYAYRWLVGGQVVGTGWTYVPRRRDVGKRIRVKVTVTRPDYHPVSDWSARTAKVKPRRS